MPLPSTSTPGPGSSCGPFGPNPESGGLAVESGAKRLVLFHHDPIHDDAAVHRMADELRAEVPAGGPEIIVAVEGLVLHSGVAASGNGAEPSVAVGS